MTRIARTFILGALLLFIAGRLGLAADVPPEPVEARIAVVDPDGAVLPGASLTLCHAIGDHPRRCTRPTRPAAADRDGMATIELPHEGDQWLLVTLEGFYETWVGPLTAAGADDWQVDLDLRVILNPDPAQTRINTI